MRNLKKIITFKIDKIDIKSGSNFYLINQWDDLDQENHDSDNYTANSYWSNKDNYYRTAVYLSGVLERFVIDLANYFNNYHSENKDAGYWKIIADEWALLFLWQVFTQWEALREISKNKECAFVLKNVIDTHRAPTCLDKHDFTNEDWNQLLSKDILDAMGKSNYEVIDYKHHELKTPRLRPLFLYQKFRRTAKKLKDLLSHRPEMSCDGALVITNDLFGYFKVDVNTTNCLPFKVTIFQYDTFLSNSKSNKKRKISERSSIKNSAALDEFELVLYKIAHNYIPQSLMEDRFKYLEQTQKLINLGRPKAICSSGIDYCDQWSYYLAALKEIEVPTYRYQHGADYAIEEISPFLDWEFHRYDTMLSWGRCYGHNSISAFYRKPLSIEKIEHKIYEIDVLLVACEPSIYRRAEIGIRGITHPKTYETQITGAIQVLVRNGFERIVFRTRSGHHDEYGISKRLHKSFPKIKSDKYTNSIELIKKSKLVIAIYISTTFIESLYENTPAVLYLNKDRDIINEDIRSLFIEMELVGLVHWDIVSLDKFISLNKDMFQEWWTSDKLECVKKKILGLLAIPSANPFRDILGLVYQHPLSNRSEVPG